MIKIKDPDNYFFQATKNQALTYLKKSYRDSEIASIAQTKICVHEINPEDFMVQQEMIDVINRTIDLFPTKRKIIFEMIREENMPYKEVADHFNISVKAVEKHMHQAMKDLRESLRKYLSETPKDLSSNNLSYKKLFQYIFLFLC